MDNEIVKILVTTDNHLGYLERDAVRSDDSFASFEEAIINAKNLKADFVLLAGDLFHENKPSRRTLHSTFKILQKHCFGEDPIYFEIMNEQKEIFKSCNGQVNFQNPYQSISLPIFSIHGNHDDPSRDGGNDSLAAIDLFSISNYINYFGKASNVEEIVITPVLIRKLTTNIAIYGLGAIRDERLNRMWNQKKVKFVRPSVEQGRDNFFNIFVLHQNRDYGRGKKNCIHESMIPEWIDLVIWGNEHECQPRLCESLVGTFRIFQPGSSIATSLVDGESLSNPKHMGLVEVRGKQFRMTPIPYTQMRPFSFLEITLKDVRGLADTDPKIEEKIKSYLTAKVNEMIASTRLEADRVSSSLPELIFRVKDPNLVLIRLRVDHMGFPTLNQQRFGAQFVGEVANPSEILLFAKKKMESVRATEGYNDKKSTVEIDEDVDEEEIDKIKIDELVKEKLGSGNKPLSILLESDMAQALEDFVIRKAPNAILDIVEESLDKTQSELFADLTADNATKIQHIAKELKKKNEELTLKGQRQIKRATTYGVDSDEEDGGGGGGAYGKLDSNSESEYEENQQGKKKGEKGKKVEVSGASSGRPGPGRGRGNATKSASAGRGSGSGSGSARGRGRGSGNAKSTKNLSSSPMSPKPSKRSSYADEIEDDDSSMENTSVKKRSKFNSDAEEADDSIEDNYKGSIFANKNKKNEVSTLSQKSTNSNSKSSKQSTLQFGSLPLGGRTSNRLTGKEKISYDESWD